MLTGEPHGTTCDVEVASVPGSGRYVAFTSDAPTLAMKGDARERRTSSCTAFVSFATNLVPNDTNEAMDVFVGEPLH